MCRALGVGQQVIWCWEGLEQGRFPGFSVEGEDLPSGYAVMFVRLLIRLMAAVVKDADNLFHRDQTLI